MRRNWLTGLLAGVAGSVLALVVVETIQAQSAATPATGRVASINVLRIRNDYQRYKDLLEEDKTHRERLTKEEEERKARITTLESEIDALANDEPTRPERMRQWMQMQIDYKNWGEMAQLTLAREFGLWSIEAYKDIYKAAEELARQQGYDLVLFAEPFEPMSIEPQALENQVRLQKVIYANPTVDITQLVLDRLNEQYRAVPRQKMMQIP